MRHWLELYDSGESESAIAKAAHRDTRTVKKRLAQARRERDVHGARMELLKNALKQHQDRLLNSVKEMESAIVMPANDLWRAYSQNAFTSPLGFIGSTLTHKEGSGWTVHMAAEEKPEWELVQEHLKGDPVWNSLSTWRRAFEAYVDARANLEAKCVDLLRERTGYKIVGRSDEPPFIYYYPTLDLIHQAVLNRTLGVEQKMEFEEMIQVDKAIGEVKYGIGAIMAEAPGEEEQCRANILTAFKELPDSKEAMKVGLVYKGLEESITKARRAVEEILLLEMVPGECRVCRRLGM